MKSAEICQKSVVDGGVINCRRVQCVQLLLVVAVHVVVQREEPAGQIHGGISLGALHVKLLVGLFVAVLPCDDLFQVVRRHRFDDLHGLLRDTALVTQLDPNSQHNGLRVIAAAIACPSVETPSLAPPLSAFHPQHETSLQSPHSTIATRS